MTRPLCLLFLFFMPLAVENLAQNAQEGGTHYSTALAPRIEMALRDG